MPFPATVEAKHRRKKHKTSRSVYDKLHEANQKAVEHVGHVSFGNSGSSLLPTTPYMIVWSSYGSVIQMSVKQKRTSAHSGLGHHLALGSTCSFARNLNCWYFAKREDGSVDLMSSLASSVFINMWLRYECSATRGSAFKTNTNLTNRIGATDTENVSFFDFVV